MKKTTSLLFFILSVSALAQEKNFFFKRQWFLKNTGQEITFRVKELDLLKQKGLPGIDINWVNTKSKGKEVLVAVIDSGVDQGHPDLKNRVVQGKNFLHPSDPVVDDTGHGTHVAGIIAANNNDIGIVGVAGDNTDIKILPLKVLSENTKSFSYQRKLITDYFAQAIEYAVKKKVAVINISAGFPSLVLGNKIHRAIKKAYQNNIPIVVAAGNNNKDMPVYPCSFQEVICVGSIDNDGMISEFSNFGNRVDILAPGRSILSTFPLNMDSNILRVKGYEIKRGTSQAAPLVAGIIAVMKSQNPSLNIQEIKRRIFLSAKQRPQSKFSTFGLIDMKKSLNPTQEPTYYPHLKENDQIVLKNTEMEFSFKLNVQRLGKHPLKKKVFIEFINIPGVKWEKRKLSLPSSGRLIVKGKITDQNIDHLLPLTFRLNSKVFKSHLRIAKSLSATQQIVLDASHIQEKNIRLRDHRLNRELSRLNYVVKPYQELSNPEYFYVDRGFKDKKLIQIAFVKISEGKVQKKSLLLAKQRKLAQVIKGDYNLDGQDDYLVITRTKHTEDKETHFVHHLYYLDQDFKPLWKDSIFELNRAKTLFNQSSGVLFPFDQKEAQFHFVRYQHDELGKIMVPVLSKKGFLPEQDNSTDLFDYQAPSLRTRQYLLIPNTKEQSLDLRVLFSIDRLSKLSEELHKKSFESFKFEGFLKGNPLKTKKLTALISVGEYLQRRYYKISFSSYTNYSIQPLDNFHQGIVLSNNNIFRVHGLTPNASLFLALSDGDKARAFFLNQNGQYYSQKIQTQKWRDPLFGFIGAYQQDNNYTSWLESRYWIYYYQNNEPARKIRLSRESSFPGESFSETMKMVSGDNVYVNSTLIYGNQLYVIKPKLNELIRPITTSIQIPSSCTALNPSKLDGSSFHYMVLQCFENGHIRFRFIPIH